MKRRVAHWLGAGLLVVRTAHADRELEERRRTNEPPGVTFGGYVEAYGSYNGNRPSNNVTALRDFDARSDSFVLQNAVVQMEGHASRFSGWLALQLGQTGPAYYSQADRRFSAIQEAYAGYDVPLGTGLLTEAGIFLSPLGMEDLAVKDEWNWSRSLVWTGLPTYHAGIRSTYQLSKASSAQVAVYNGWNDIVGADGNKSVSVAYFHDLTDDVKLTAMYFGGLERPRGAPEGNPWRHLLDVFAELRLAPRLSAIVYTDGGLEPNRLGLSGWAAGALYARVELAPWLHVAWRGDLFFEKRAQDGGAVASPIFWSTRWVSSETATLDFRPHDHVSVRLEYRHDLAATPAFYAGLVQGDGSASRPWIPNARAQDTLTLGMTTWF
jgi:Putative beta-barrel porin-2, OmpL-like. bbp2